MLLTTQYIYKIHKHFLPKTLISFWIRSTIKHIPNFNADLMLNFRFVDNDEGYMLNKTYRHKDYATNVLTFVYDDDFIDDIDTQNQSITSNITADIVLSCDVVEKEAKAEQKPLIAHYAHLIIHGVLHAYGYEHDTDEDNERMQALETQIMLYLGFNCPYTVNK
ncbi:MAG: hypothetical protein RLZZ210_964 [Pseudomonadota bacterium]|jgi:probable rRNA maturation factor